MPTALTSDGYKVAWEFCRVCTQHCVNCACDGGPFMPLYLQQWVDGEAAPAPTADETPSFYVPPVRKAERHPTGRKVRADKGVPRSTVSAAPTSPSNASPALNAPCAMHTAESRLNPDGSFTCTVEGCAGV